MNFIPINKLQFPQLDAVMGNTSYYRDLFIRTFYSDEKLELIKKPNIFFVIGDKGTGKTAYATFLESKNDKHNRMHTYIAPLKTTNYTTFAQLKQNNKIGLDDYDDIWSLLLLLMLAKIIADCERANGSVQRGIKLNVLKKYINSFYKSGQLPTITKLLNITEKHKNVAEAIAKLKVSFTEASATLGEHMDIETSFENYTLSDSSSYITRELISIISEIRMSKEYVIFIDGIDIRPDSIQYDEYIACIRGLADAAWYLNVEILQKNKLTRGIRFVLLLRPDIFDEINMVNSGLKLMNNSVLLNWTTSYIDYRQSSLFKLADQLLYGQQVTKKSERLDVGKAWDNYFGYKIPRYNYHTSTFEDNKDGSFIDFLRYSFHRPRDIIALLAFVQQNSLNILVDPATATQFPKINFKDRNLSQLYWRYLKEEVKESLVFYHSRSYFGFFITFFSYLKDYVDLNSLEFSYDSYVNAFTKFANYFNTKKDSQKIHIYESHDTFLQILYELNIISYIEESNKSSQYRIFRWYFRRDIVIEPHSYVRTHCNYKLHNGMAAAFGIKTILEPELFDSSI